MAKKSLFNNFISRAAKATDKAIRDASRQREIERKSKIARERKAEIAKVPDGYVKINIDSFLNKYIKGGVISPELLIELQMCKTKYTYIHKSVIEELEKKKEKHEAFERKLTQCARLNNRGIAYEKEGKIDLAINTYEENISGDCYAACHSFDRLMILYRKAKDYDNEIRVINKAIDVLCERHPDLRTKYESRLTKSELLKEKQILKTSKT